jgi:ferritin-like metal-binding protein YciE
MNLRSPDDLLTQQLRDIYSAEKQLSRALPRLSKAIQAQGLQSKLQERLEEGKVLLEAIDQVFDEFEITRGRQKCEAVEGMIEEASQHMEEIEPKQLLDAALLGDVQKIQHYCIAAWGTAAALARPLGKDSAVKTFEQALEHGKRFDKEMTELAVKEVNPAAMRLEGDEERPPGKSGSKSTKH